MSFRNLPALALALASFLAVPGGAAAEASAALPPRVEVAVGDGRPEPAETELARGERFVFVNRGEAMARIVFRRRASDAVSCEGGETGRPGQYLLRAGGRLDCTARDSGDYEVFRSDGNGGLDVEAGRVAVDG